MCFQGRHHCCGVEDLKLSELTEMESGSVGFTLVTSVLYSVVTKMKFVGKWVEPDNTVLSEVIQAWENKIHSQMLVLH